MQLQVGSFASLAAAFIFGGIVRVEYVALGFSILALILAVIAYLGQREIWSKLDDEQAPITEAISRFPEDHVPDA